MDFDQDRLLLARAQISDLLDALRLTNFDTSPVQFFMRLDAIRHTAISHRFEAVAEIALHFEEAMQRSLHRSSHRSSQSGGGSAIVAQYYTDILDESVGCGNMGAEIAQSLLASVALRLGA